LSAHGRSRKDGFCGCSLGGCIITSTSGLAQGRKARDLGLLLELEFAFLAQWLVQSLPEWWFDVQLGLSPRQAEFSMIPVEALAPLSRATSYTANGSSRIDGASGTSATGSGSGTTATVGTSVEMRQRSRVLTEVYCEWAAWI
jgi:hypothetical protein